MSFPKSGSVTHRLNDLPNISIALGEELKRVGVSTPQDLYALGAEESWSRLRAAGLRDCIQTLLALEGAVTGVAWQSLSPQRRGELVRFMTHSTDFPAHRSDIADTAAIRKVA